MSVRGGCHEKQINCQLNDWHLHDTGNYHHWCFQMSWTDLFTALPEGCFVKWKKRDDNTLCLYTQTKEVFWGLWTRIQYQSVLSIVQMLFIHILIRSSKGKLDVLINQPTFCKLQLLKNKGSLLAWFHEEHPWKLSTKQKFFLWKKVLRLFKMIFTLRKNGSFKNCSIKGSLGIPALFFHRIAVKTPFGTFIFLKCSPLH